MNHTLDELLDIAFRYYPRGVGTSDHLDTPRIEDTEEHARLVAARKRAAVDERWNAMQRRISERFPDTPFMNQSLHLPTGTMDACYSFTLFPPEIPGRQDLWFLVSFLAPYYIIFSSRLTDTEIATSPRGFKVVLHGVPVTISKDAASSVLLNPDDESLKTVTIQRRDFVVTFDLSPDERPYAEWIAREIEATFGVERLPAEVGDVLVPEVVTTRRSLGKARLYDCLFSDDHQWVMPSASEVWAPALEIEASRLTDRAMAAATVLVALFHIGWALMPKTSGAYYGSVDTDGVLHKEEVLGMLAWIRPLLESPANPCGIAAKGELEGATRQIEALVAAWDCNGAPPDAMVAWASSFLASWDVGENGGSRE
jgi:hypothetical protein